MVKVVPRDLEFIIFRCGRKVVEHGMFICEVFYEVGQPRNQSRGIIPRNKPRGVQSKEPIKGDPITMLLSCLSQAKHRALSDFVLMLFVNWRGRGKGR